MLEEKMTEIILTEGIATVDLINYADIPYKTVLNIQDATLDVIEDEKLQEGFLKFPEMDELFPYPNAIRKYIESRGVDIPARTSASKYLKKLGLIDDFYAFRQKVAVEYLVVWCQSRGFLLKDKEKSC